MQQPLSSPRPKDWLQFVLLSTKLELPELPEGTIDRPRLSGMIRAVSSRKAALLVAPAGSGKSTLLGCWTKRWAHQAACVALDEGDNDPLVFWLYILHAIDRARPGLAEEILPAFMPLFPANPRSALNLLLNACSRDEEPLLLVLDDYHAIRDEAIHTGVAFFIEHMPPGFHVVLASRTLPPLKLERLRSRGGLTEVNLGDLAFSKEEAIELCRDSMQLDISDEQAIVWQERTEGWAAGMKLLAMSHGRSGIAASETAAASESLQAISANERWISDYLFEEVFQQQPEPVKHFLLSTSVLSRMNSRLSAALAEIEQGGLMLRHLEKEHLFLVPLDAEGEWYRYHHLFSQFLRKELKTVAPDKIASLHLTAGRWLEQAGLPAEAMIHYLEGGHTDAAADLLEELFSVLIMQEWWTLRRYFDQLPMDAIVSRPKLYLSYLFLVCGEQPYEKTSRQMDELEEIIGRFVDSPEQQGYLFCIVCVMRAYIAYLNKDLNGLSRYLIEYIDKGYPDDEAFSYMDYERRESMRLRSFHGVTGSLKLAEECFGAIVKRWFDEPAYVTSYYGVGYAEMLLEKNRLGEAERYAARSLEIAKQLKYAALLVPATVLQAKLRFIQGYAAEAARLLGELEAELTETDAAYWHPAVTAHKNRLLLETEESEAFALRLLEQPAPELPEKSCDQLNGSLIRVRAMLKLERHEEALAELQRIRQLAEGRELLTERIETELLEAAVYVGKDLPHAALAALSKALRLAEPEGYVRSFISEGAVIRKLLASYASMRRSNRLREPEIGMAYVKQLLLAIETDEATAHARNTGSADINGADAQNGITASKAVSISPMEQKILGYISKGYTSKHIAVELGISAGTVNTHIRRVFGKLNASSRTHAVQIASQLGLL